MFFRVKYFIFQFTNHKVRVFQVQNLQKILAIFENICNKKFNCFIVIMNMFQMY